MGVAAVEVHKEGESAEARHKAPLPQWAAGRRAPRQRDPCWDGGGPSRAGRSPTPQTHIVSSGQLRNNGIWRPSGKKHGTHGPSHRPSVEAGRAKRRHKCVQREATRQPKRLLRATPGPKHSLPTPEPEEAVPKAKDRRRDHRCNTKIQGGQSQEHASPDITRRRRRRMRRVRGRPPRACLQ